VNPLKSDSPFLTSLEVKHQFSWIVVISDKSKSVHAELVGNVKQVALTSEPLFAHMPIRQRQGASQSLRMYLPIIANE
jgi:hypothetical protein